MRLFIFVFIIFFCQEAFTSGATVARREGKFYSLLISTPSLSFATDAKTGESGEQQYHQQAKNDFEAILKKYSKQIEKNVEILKTEFNSKVLFIPYQPKLAIISQYTLGDAMQKHKGPCQMSFAIRFPEMGALSLAFAELPSHEVYNAIEERVKTLFSKNEMEKN